MKDAIENSWPTWSKAQSSRKKDRLNGNAATADTFSKAWKHLKSAQLVSIREATLNSGLKTINSNFLVSLSWEMLFEDAQNFFWFSEDVEVFHF